MIWLLQPDDVQVIDSDSESSTANVAGSSSVQSESHILFHVYAYILFNIPVHIKMNTAEILEHKKINLFDLIVGVSWYKFFIYRHQEKNILGTKTFSVSPSLRFQL